LKEKINDNWVVRSKHVLLLEFCPNGDAATLMEDYKEGFYKHDEQRLKEMFKQVLTGV